MKKVVFAIALIVILLINMAVIAIASEDAASPEATYPYSSDGASYGFVEQENGAIFVEGVGNNGGKYSVLFDRVIGVIMCSVIDYYGQLCKIPVFLVPKSGTNVTVNVDPNSIKMLAFYSEDETAEDLPSYDVASYFIEDDGIYHIVGGGINYTESKEPQAVTVFKLPVSTYPEEYLNGGMIERVTFGEAIFYYGATDGIGDTIDQDNVDINPFTDVDSSKYYYKPVLWAVEKNIVSGTSTKFSPDEACPRSEVVTFIWKAMGETEPTLTVNPFTDVSENDYYYKAVLWAYEQGITSGTSDTTFSPDTSCTRGQVVTFLWRAEGKPVVSGSNNFRDVDSNAYYVDAVNWAVSKNITSGTSATEFSPGDTCTRGHIITFLYRNYIGK